MAQTQEHTGDPILCPRCNYDQSGVIDSWKESCPLNGVCSECGLDLFWPDLVTRRITPVPWWSVEREGLRWPMRIPLAWMLALRPKLVWTRLRMEHSIVYFRLVVLLFASIFAVHGAGGAARVVQRFTVESVMADLPQSYIQIIPAGRLASWKLIDAQRQGVKSYIVDTAWPWSDVLHTWAGTYSIGEGFTIPGFFLIPVWCVVCAPMVLLVLPDTRKRAKVRLGHVLRVGAQTVALVPVIALIMGSVLGFMINSDFRLSYWNPVYGSPHYGVRIAIVFVLVSTILFVLWSLYKANVHYLKLDRPLAVTVATGAVAVVASVTLWGLTTSDELAGLMGMLGL